jgi:hypothetical protein
LRPGVWCTGSPVMGVVPECETVTG